MIRNSFGVITLLLSITGFSQRPDSADVYYKRIESHFHINQEAYVKEVKGLLRYASHNNDSVAFARGYHSLGIHFHETGRYDSALYFQKKARRLFHNQKNLNYEAQSLNNLGVIYKSMAEYGKAIESSLEAMKIADKENIVRAKVYARTNTGESYYRMGDLKNAKPMFEMAYKIADENQEQELAADASVYLGNIFLGAGDLEGALQAYNRAYQVKRLLKRYIDIDGIVSNIGAVYFYKGNLNKALEYYFISLQYSKQLKNPNQETIAKMNIAEADGALKNYTRAHIYLDSAILLAKRLGNKNFVSSGYAMKRDFFEKQHNLSDALKSLELSHIYKDSVINEASNRHIAELQEKYQAEKRTQEIESLNQQSTIQQLSIAKQRIYFGLGFIILLFAGVSSYQFQRSRRLKEKMIHDEKIKEERDKAAQLIIESELNERRRIAAELHDGVVQTFSAAKMNLSGITDSVSFTNSNHQKVYENTMMLIDEGCSELRSISHSMMPEALLKKGLPEALRELVNRIDTKGIAINLGIYGFHQRINSNIETSVYRVVQESVNNSIKHSNATTVDIQVSLDENRLNLTIEDNGRGFEKSQILQSSGIGLRNIVSRVNLLSGEIDIDSKSGEGTLIAITLPLSKHNEN